MAAIAFKVSPTHSGWAISHNDVPMASFKTKEEAQRAALAVAVRHPADKTARVDLENGDGPPDTMLVF